MAAIYGIIGETDEGLLAAMGARLAHRGPTPGDWVYSSALLGERTHDTAPARLAADGIALVAEADIYNLDELRDDLIARGAVFETDRPDEVFLHGYARFGTDFFSRVNGDYNLAIWDGPRNTLLLVRDALGSRPLYYWQGDGVLAFATEYKALLALPFVPAEPDRDAIQHLQYTKSAPRDRTLLKGILSVPAGHFMEYTAGDLRFQRHFTIQLDPQDLPEAAHAEAVRQKFLAAVDRRIGPLTRMGATLSGGVDSASVVAAMRHVRPELDILAFTCGYGPGDPEIRTAAVTARATGAAHFPVYVRPEDFPPLLPKVVWHLEDPVARTETVLTYETARRAAEQADVVMTGYEADLLFGGMPKYKILKLIDWLPFLKAPLGEFYNYTQVSVLPESAAGKAMQRLYYRGKDSPPPATLGASGPLRADPLPAEDHERLNQVLRNGLHAGVRGLLKADRVHLAHGLRFRSPFTDMELIRTAFQIPGNLKIRGWREKHIFREAIRPLLPPDVLNTPKFPQAVQYDLAFSEVMETLTRETLSLQAMSRRGFFNPADIERLARRAPGEVYSAERSMRLWTAVLTELWARIFIDCRGEAPQA